FFDVLDDESRVLRQLGARFISSAEAFGFREVRTASVEVRDRYLAATSVHPSRIFEVHRPKEGSRFVLQADLAMGMSRFIADLPSAPPLKLAQVSSLFRDRQPDRPGHRRQFEMAVLGTWGLRDPYADAEILAAAHDMLENVPGLAVTSVQFGNPQVFARLAPGLAQDIRFTGQDIGTLLAATSLDPGDRELLTDLYTRGRIPLDEFRAQSAGFEDPRVREEVAVLLATACATARALPDTDLHICLSELHGTGHYSGVTYQVFITAPDRLEPFSIADGGRIDQLCKALGGPDVPAACLGVGLTVLAGLLPPQVQERKVVLLFDDADAPYGVAGDIRARLRETGVHSTMMPLPRRKWPTVLKSQFYADHGFVLIEADRVTIRHADLDERQALTELLTKE
ncbi:ATP phosphoribosyltransferase regulatory subunit, partial [Streptomyces sulfonofaciens]|uniref:ATP phosphoribosyltransferase regulatory subunit n=1 Tax=Streptomyces sulfonofaciens TaxID=68272 RepID=UPI00167B1DAD